MATTTYTVVSGDTLSKIGTKTGYRWQDIASLNKIVSPYVIRIGQVLKLPVPVVVTPTPKPVPTPTPTPTPTPVSNKAFSTTAPFRDRLWGVYAETPGKEGTLWGMESLRDIETKLGYKFPIVSGFVGYDEVPTGNMKVAAAEGRTTILSYDVEVKFSAIIAGTYDSKFKAVAASCKAINGPVYLRLWAEMNGDWASWSVSSNQNVASHAEWIAAWRHIVTLFRAAGASNVKFVFCPNVTDEPTSDHFEQYWPGAEYVDALGFDSYNWGSPWQSHKTIFTNIYNRVTALDPDLPVWVGEFASAEGTNKAAWITALLDETGFPRIQALCWFSVNKEKDWRMDSTAASTAAFKAGFAK